MAKRKAKVEGLEIEGEAPEVKAGELGTPLPFSTKPIKTDQEVSLEIEMAAMAETPAAGMAWVGPPPDLTGSPASRPPEPPPDLAEKRKDALPLGILKGPLFLVDENDNLFYLDDQGGDRYLLRSWWTG